MPQGTFYSLNYHPYNDPSAPNNMVDTRLQPDPSVSFMGGKKYKNKTRKQKGGGFFTSFTDFLLGPSSTFAPITSFGTTAGSVSDANTLFGNRGYVNDMPYSQPISYKFNSNNLPMV